MSLYLDADMACTDDINKVIKGYEDRSIHGSYRDPEGLQRLLADLDMPLFGAAAWELQDTGEGKVSLPYKAAVKFDPEFGKYERQTTGDCVSHSTRNSGTIDYSIDAAMGKSEYRGRLCTENIYGYRGHGGQGASCSRLAGYVSTNGPGGFLTRKKYDDGGSRSVDLSVYNSRTGHNWGRSGTPEWLNDIAENNKAETISLVSQLEEARDAIANGYGISVCSGYGFSSKRDSLGMARRSGSWSHAMSWIGCIDDHNDEAYKATGGPVFLVQNSWGIWNSGPTRHDQPPGSFWIDYKTATGMLRSRGAWVVSKVKGYQRRNIEYIML